MVLIAYIRSEDAELDSAVAEYLHHCSVSYAVALRGDEVVFDLVNLSSHIILGSVEDQLLFLEPRHVVVAKIKSSLVKKILVFGEETAFMLQGYDVTYTQPLPSRNPRAVKRLLAALSAFIAS